MIEALLAPFAAVGGVLAMTSVVAVVSGLVAYAGWLVNEAGAGETRTYLVADRLRWWMGYGRDRWEGRFDRRDDLLKRTTPERDQPS